MDFSGCLNDSADVFDPVVKGCRGNFDFTIQFETIFFSLIPNRSVQWLHVSRHDMRTLESIAGFEYRGSLFVMQPPYLLVSTAAAAPPPAAFNRRRRQLADLEAGSFFFSCSTFSTLS